MNGFPAHNALDRDCRSSHASRLHGDHRALLDRRVRREAKRLIAEFPRRARAPSEIFAEVVSGDTLAVWIRRARRFSGQLRDLQRLPADLEYAAFHLLRTLQRSLAADYHVLDPQLPDSLLIHRIRCTHAAEHLLRNRLAEAFRGLAGALARKMTNQRFPLDELQSEADQALLRCLETFDPERGFRFSTYATHAIRRRLYHYVMKSRRRELLSLDTTGVQPLAPSQPSDVDHLRRWRVATQLRQCIEEVLTDRERSLVLRRLEWTPTEGGNSFRNLAAPLGVSRERARQIYEKAIAKIRKAAEHLEDPFAI